MKLVSLETIKDDGKLEEFKDQIELGLHSLRDTYNVSTTVSYADYFVNVAIKVLTVDFVVLVSMPYDLLLRNEEMFLVANEAYEIMRRHLENEWIAAIKK